MSDETNFAAMGRDELERYAATCDLLSDDRDRLLAAIPECPHHGPCVPYALAWLEKARSIVPELSLDEIPTQTVEQVESVRRAIASVQ